MKQLMMLLVLDYLVDHQMPLEPLDYLVDPVDLVGLQMDLVDLEIQLGLVDPGIQ